MNAEIYTNPYGGPSQVDFDDTKTKLRVIRPYFGVNKNGTGLIIKDGKEDNRTILVINDESKSSFWPVIIRLDDKEVRNLIEALNDAFFHNYKTEGGQFDVVITNEGPKKK